MMGSQGANSFRVKGAPFLVRQFAAEAGKGSQKSNTGLYVALAALGAGGGYYFWTQQGGASPFGGGVDYQKVVKLTV